MGIACRRGKNITVSSWNDFEPYHDMPISNPRCTPLGLMPKKTGSLRLIIHMSYTPGAGINDFIDPQLTSVSYSNVERRPRILIITWIISSLLARPKMTTVAFQSILFRTFVPVYLFPWLVKMLGAHLVPSHIWAMCEILYRCKFRFRGTKLALWFSYSRHCYPNQNVP